MTGFIVTDRADRTPDFLRDVRRWLAEGKVTAPETVMTGIESAPAALIALLEGGNVGKMVVKLA